MTKPPATQMMVAKDTAMLKDSWLTVLAEDLASKLEKAFEHADMSVVLNWPQTSRAPPTAQ
jgi:hypothetical protein